MRYPIVLLIAFCTLHAYAKIPDDYAPVVVEAPFSFSERVFDLSRAVDEARRENRPIYIYLGAEDCPPCKVYFRFLQANREKLKPSFDKVVVVDIRTWLKGPTLVFKINDKRYSFAQFKALVGDTNTAFQYPYYWLVTPGLLQIKQLPIGTRNYMPVDKQIEVLRLP